MPPGGIPIPGDDDPWAPVRRVIDGALIGCHRVSEALEPGADAGHVPSGVLGDQIESRLRAVYEAESGGQNPARWLAVALGAPADQLADAGPAILARLLDDTSNDPTLDFGIPPMTDEEDAADAERAAAAARLFGEVPDHLPKEAAR